MVCLQTRAAVQGRWGHGLRTVVFDQIAWPDEGLLLIYGVGESRNTGQSFGRGQSC